MGYYNCKCGCRHKLGVSCPQLLTNTTNVVPVKGLNLYELDLAMGKYPPETTYEEWRAMQEQTNEITEYGDNA